MWLYLVVIIETTIGFLNLPTLGILNVDINSKEKFRGELRLRKKKYLLNDEKIFTFLKPVTILGE